ncbi:MAG: PAS domain-containing sensor histidine kinase, partial [Rhodospirillales bacterium]|nr:PAS domain-containing sensor histidine kinase [Rhodospirillales bacterium]
GKGISEDVRERLFEPFFTTKDAGMGIGLLICQTIIEEHGGMLDVAPVISGGTVVSFTLPFEKADSERSPLDRR